MTQTDVCTRLWCDDYDDVVIAEDHVHESILATFGKFEARVVVNEQAGDAWVIDAYPGSIDALLSVEDATNFLQAINLATVEAAARNQRRTVRRPTDYCAEPAQDGIGGGL